MKAGDVFRLVKAADKHAKVVVSEPARFPDRVLFVGMAPWDRAEDQSCILNVGDHSTVSHRTVMLYARASALASNADRERMVQAKLLVLEEPVSPEVLQGIREGAMRLRQRKQQARWTRDGAHKKGQSFSRLA